MKTRMVYEKVKDDLREKIGRQEFPEGRLPGERVLARQYNISHPTMNKVISLLVQEGILERVPGSGTYLKELPKKQSLAIVPSEGHVFHDFAFDLCGTLQKCGYFPSLLTSDNEVPFEQLCHPSFVPDLLVVDAFYRMSPDIIGRIPAKHLVFLHRYEFSMPLPALYILHDYESGGYKALRFLSERGCRNILVLSYEICMFLTSWLFHKGIDRAVKEGVKVKHLEFVNTDQPGYLERVKQTILTKKIDGIVSFSDFRVIPVIEELNVKPDVIKIVGYADTPWSRSYGFSSLTFNKEGMLSSLADHIKKGQFTDRVLVSPELVVRGT